MQKQKRLSVALVVVILALSLGACSTTDAQSKQVVLSLNHVGSTASQYQMGSEEFARLVEEKTSGSARVEVYPASQVASGSKAIEFVQMGSLDIALESTMSTENFIPETGVLNLPFLFEDEEEAFKILDGAVGDEIKANAEERGFIILAWWLNGFRDISNSKQPVTEPENLVGMKIRVPESTVFLKTFETMGAVPTTMASSEVFTALQLKTVDGQENPSTFYFDSKFNEVNEYYSKTHHIFTAEPLVMNLERFKSLPEDMQVQILEAAQEAALYQRQLTLDNQQNYLDEMVEAGVQVNDVSPESRARFREAVQPVYDMYQEKYGSLLEQIEAAK